MEKPSICIHAGPPKTGTTFLQRTVFDEIQSVECLPVPRAQIGNKETKFGFLFDFSPDLWEVIDLPSAVGAKSAGNTLLISDETVFGGVSSPQPWIPEPVLEGMENVLPPGLRRHTHNRPAPHDVACHLRKLNEACSKWGYGQVKFLLTPRRQDTKLASYYAEISDRVRGAGQESFEKWVRRLIHDPIGYSKGGGAKLNYFSWYEEVVRNIEEKNVFFSPFELLQENTFGFLKQWLEFVGVERAKSIADIFSESEKKRSRSTSDNKWKLKGPKRYGIFLHPSIIFKMLGLPTRLPRRLPDFWRDEGITLTKELSTEILEKYENGNRLLDDKLREVDLKKYGYY